MLVKNIGQIIKDQVPLKFRFFEGNTVYGKIISIDEGKGAIKLYDGTIIPATFISENEIDKEKFTKFIIQSFDGDNVILKAIISDDKRLQDGSINKLIKDLNIPFKEGKEIIMSLIKFNLPVTQENILSIYKNLTFINNIGSMSDDNIIDFLRKHIGKHINANSKEFSVAKEIFSKLQNINVDFLSFFLENDIPQNIDNIIKGKNLLDEKFLLNTAMDILKQLDGQNTESKSLLSLEQLINKMKNSPDVYAKIPIETLKALVDDIDILKHIYNNYNIYTLNTIDNGDLFNNNIIIKHKYKGSNRIDPDDVKVFISIKTSKIGIVECYLYKRNMNLFLSLSVNEEHIPMFKRNLKSLENSLYEKGYGIVNLSLEKIKTPTNLLGLSVFFNDTIFKELDVRA